MGGGRNFERPNVKRPIFRNLKIASVKSYESPSYSIFYLQTHFLIKKKNFRTLKFSFFSQF